MIDVIIKNIKNKLPLLVSPILLLLSFYTSMLVAPLTKIKFSNPYNISNQYNAISFNPNNNFYTFIFIIFFTLLLFIILRRLYNSKYAWVIKLIVVVLVVSNFFLAYLLQSNSFANGNVLDSFHGGEQLSVVGAFLSGSKLYSQMFFLRGAGVDVLIPAFGMHIFGNSISGFIATMDLLCILAILVFSSLLWILIKNPIKYSIALVLFYISNAVSIVSYRDIPVWIAIGLVLYIFKQKINKSYKKISMFALGLIASLNLYLSIDKGILLSILSFMLIIILVILSSDDNNFYSLKIKNWRTNIAREGSLFVFSGQFIGFIIPALLLGWDSFVSFIKMTFIEIPSFAGLLVSQPIPQLFGDQYLFWAPIFVAISVGYLLITLFKIEVKKNLNKLAPFTILFLFGVLCIKEGSNRIHITKMASVITPLYLIAALILVYAVAVFLKNRKQRLNLAIPIFVTILIICIFSQIDTSKILYQPNFTKSQLSSYLHRISRSDDSWLSNDTLNVKKYILDNTSKNDYIFAFTSDPLYYYLTNRKNPSRFYISWYADPQPYTDELLESLKKNNPKIIIYKEDSWMDMPDNISMEERIPEVSDWIKSNKYEEVNIGTTIILKLKK